MSERESVSVVASVHLYEGAPIQWHRRYLDDGNPYVALKLGELGDSVTVFVRSPILMANLLDAVTEATRVLDRSQHEDKPEPPQEATAAQAAA